LIRVVLHIVPEIKFLLFDVNHIHRFTIVNGIWIQQGVLDIFDHSSEKQRLVSSSTNPSRKYARRIVVTTRNGTQGWNWIRDTFFVSLRVVVEGNKVAAYMGRIDDRTMATVFFGIWRFRLTFCECFGVSFEDVALFQNRREFVFQDLVLEQQKAL